jgi:nitroimidazol reductase NimA-like FMN-containing flavoprotein (pyridoxamine 5'-phosphate oxidase superfamily)
MAPRIERPAIPPEYGASRASTFVEWSHVEDRLTSDRAYWIVTVGHTGRPSVRPVDGLFVDGALYVGGSPDTRWIRDLGANPMVAVHLDGLADVIIVEGSVEILDRTDADLAERLADASKSKYPEYGVTAELYRRRGAIRIRPRTVVTWTDISKDPTRFRFED